MANIFFHRREHEKQRFRRALRQALGFSALTLVSLVLCGEKLFSQQTEKIYLSGTGSDNTVNWQFFCTAGMNSGKWSTIPVPSCWELQGFGKYDYGFAKDSIRGKEKGLYKYNFNVPASWKNKTVKIVFEGSMTDTEVKINGKRAGDIHQGAFYAFSYNITSLLKYGQSNLLEVTVAKHSTNESVNNAERRADFWIFGGIFRPVYLEVLPQVHIESIAIDAKATGRFISKVTLNAQTDKVSVQLLAADGSQYGPVLESAVDGKNVALFNEEFTSPKLWSPEFPNLYTAVFTLYSNGKPVHTTSKRIGFRTVEVREKDGVYVNGVKMKFKGVNRHSFRPESGRTTSKKISIEDVLLMKDMNMNAVRMSHYPPDDHFLDVCDSLGLFVMDELAGWHGHYDTNTGGKLLKEMITHDVNHPSIVFWANGNEGGHNFDLDTLFTEYDIQQRPVVHPWQLFGGIETQHYREYNYGIGSYDHGTDIVMPTEFLHGLYDGGHGAGLEDYWEMMWRKPLSAGGFLWDFADQGVVRTDKNGIIDTDGNRGADGIVGPHHEKEGSYFAIKEIWSPIYFEPKEITPQFDGSLNIENRYHFTNTSQCSFSYKLRTWFGFSGDSIFTDPITAPDIRPNEKGVLKIELPENWSRYDVLWVTVKDPYNRELFTWSFPIYRNTAMILKFPTDSTLRVNLQETDSLYQVSAQAMNYSIHKRTGMLVDVRKNGRIIPFNNGPVLQEGVNNFGGFTHRFEDGVLVIESAFDRKKNYNTLKWEFHPSGIVRLKVNYFPGDYFTSFTGINFSFPEAEMKGVLYMGYGPYRVWRNRLKGNKFSVWEKKYNNTETGEAPWIYPEFKGYHAKMYWCSFYTVTDTITVFTNTEDIFLRLFTPAFKTDQWRNYELIFPSGDISFMQGIPGIGTKTQRNETTGPMGMKNIYYDYEKDPKRWRTIQLTFDFGY
jgi:hypothetical protein